MTLTKKQKKLIKCLYLNKESINSIVLKFNTKELNKILEIKPIYFLLIRNFLKNKDGFLNINYSSSRLFNNAILFKKEKIGDKFLVNLKEYLKENISNLNIDFIIINELLKETVNIFDTNKTNFFTITILNSIFEYYKNDKSIFLDLYKKFKLKLNKNNTITSCKIMFKSLIILEYLLSNNKWNKTFIKKIVKLQFNYMNKIIARNNLAHFMGFNNSVFNNEYYNVDIVKKTSDFLVSSINMNIKNMIYVNELIDKCNKFKKYEILKCICINIDRIKIKKIKIILLNRLLSMNGDEYNG